MTFFRDLWALDPYAITWWITIWLVILVAGSIWLHEEDDAS